MREVNFQSEGETSIRLDEIGVALAVCDHQGLLVGGSPAGRDLLTRMGAEGAVLPSALVPELWQTIVTAPVGQATQWREGVSDGEPLLGFTRYPLGSSRWLLVMSEISQKQNVLAQRLQAQRLEALGRLVATTVHDLRAPLASILYNADLLATRFDELSPDRMREMIGDVRTGAERLRSAIDCLLDYVRLGRGLPTDVSIREALERVQSLLRPFLRTGNHELIIEVGEAANVVLANPLAVEQILVNLVINSIEAATAPVRVRISSTAENAQVRILVADNGPGIRLEHRFRIFDPFFTTKTDGTGIGLTSAREAARAAGGDLELVAWVGGASFAVLLPASKVAHNQ